MSYGKLIFNKGSFFALMTILLDVAEWSFLDPILTARFEEEGVSETWASMAFLAASIPYVVSCYLLHHFEAKFGYKACL